MISIRDVISAIRKYLHDSELVAVPMHSLEDKLGMPPIRRGQGRNVDYYPRYMIEELKRGQNSSKRNNEAEHQHSARAEVQRIQNSSVQRRQPDKSTEQK